MAWRFAAALAKARTSRDRAALRKEMPAVNAAHRIYQANGPTRWIVEARLLARQSDEEIAQAVGLEAGVVEWFEKLFLHVRDRLESTSWLVLGAIGKKALTGLTKDDKGVILKMLGLFGGPLVVDVAIPILMEVDSVQAVYLSPEHTRMRESLWRLVNAMPLEIEPDFPAAAVELLSKCGRPRKARTRWRRSGTRSKNISKPAEVAEAAPATAAPVATPLSNDAAHRTPMEAELDRLMWGPIEQTTEDATLLAIPESG